MTGQVINLKSSIVKIRFSEFYDFDLNSMEDLEYGFEIRNLSNSEFKVLKNSLTPDQLIKFSSDKIIVLIKSLSEFLKLSAIFEQSGFAELSSNIKKFLSYDSSEFTFAGLKTVSSKPLIMGILNVTDDSFYDGGKHFEYNSALEQANKLIREGADIIDIGGESTRPFSDPVSAKTEMQRTIPIIEKLISENPGIVISIDTTKPEVAESAVNSGAKIINDISGGTFDQKIWEVAAKYQASYILMHILDKPKTMQQNPQYKEVISDIYDYLKRQTDKAFKAGIKEIAIDPGIGFGKRIVDNFEILLRLEEFKSFNLPILIGLSNKSFLGKSQNLDVDKRDIPTVTAEVEAVKSGARIIRTHNVKNLVEAVNTINFIKDPSIELNV